MQRLYERLKERGTCFNEMSSNEIQLCYPQPFLCMMSTVLRGWPRNRKRSVRQLRDTLKREVSAVFALTTWKV